MTPLALSSVEKSVTVQTHTRTQTNEQTVNDISTPCLSACVDSNTNMCHLPDHCWHIGWWPTSDIIFTTIGCLKVSTVTASSKVLFGTLASTAQPYFFVRHIRRQTYCEMDWFAVNCCVLWWYVVFRLICGHLRHCWGLLLLICGA